MQAVRNGTGPDLVNMYPSDAVNYLNEGRLVDLSVYINDPEIGIEWPEVKGEYKGSASAEGYTLTDGTALNLSDKDQKWLGLKDTFKF